MDPIILKYLLFFLIEILIFFFSFSDTKNSVGLVGCIEEVSHNAIAVYWNPLESSAKVKIAFKFIEIPFIQGNYRYFLAKYE